jgi:translation elongation factor P/translation initiation factor 5A
MKCVKFFVLAGVLILTAGVAIADQSSGTSSSKPATQPVTQEKEKAVVHHETGTVSSVTGTELVLAHKWRGKEEKAKFTLDSSTKKEGSIAQGGHVTVYYHFEDGQRVATELKASQTKPHVETRKP